MMVTSVIKELWGSGLGRSTRTGDKTNAPILPTNSTLMPSWAIFFPSRIRTTTYVKSQALPTLRPQ